VSPYEEELRECLTVVLGAAPPVPEYEAFLFFRQWLAERNLGLVPIANARDFDWPGHWLARVRSADGDHVVVMFGSPSGAFHDPSNALDGAGTIEEGWLLARIDVSLPIEEPYGQAACTGSVAAILVAPRAESPLTRVETVAAIAGRGLEGDRYGEGRGTFSGPGHGYELTLVEAEVLDSIGLPWEEGRRNVVTRGLALNALVGRRFKIGAVECVGRRLAEPCAHLEKLTRPGLLRPLVHRAGVRADILRGGSICIGDQVVVTD
jgi:hypothetical protein